MFETERFLAECREALAETDSQQAVRELVARAVSRPSEVVRALGTPERAGVYTLVRSDELTVLNLVWGPGMDLFPHDHRMWAVIGIYGGREDNTFWSRGDSTLVRQRMKTLVEGDAVPLGEKVIHSVRNPLDRLTAALHVYGGDFFGAERSEWDPVTLEEQRYDPEHTMQAFAAATARLDAARRA